MTTWTLFGKTPREGDFVRHALREPIAVECFRWVADAVAQQPSWVRAVPPQGVRFVYAGTGASVGRALVGTMIASRDRVGREFPLVAVRSVRDAEIARGLPGIAIAWSAALGDARRALERVPSEGVTTAASLLEVVAAPTPADLRAAYARAAHALQLAPLDEFQERVLGGAGRGGALDAAAHYAYHTVRVAAAQLGRGTAPALACPVALASDATAWLELVLRLAPSRDRALTFAWTTGPAARLVICLGDPPPSALHAVVGDAAESSRVWPLTTTSETAIAKAIAAIAPSMPPARASIAALIDALAKSASAGYGAPRSRP